MNSTQHKARPWLHVSDEQSRPRNSTEAIFLQHCKAWEFQKVSGRVFFCAATQQDINICLTEKTIGQSHAPFFTFECIFCDSAWERRSKSTENLQRIKGLKGLNYTYTQNENITLQTSDSCLFQISKVDFHKHFADCKQIHQLTNQRQRHVRLSQQHDQSQ